MPHACENQSKHKKRNKWSLQKHSAFLLLAKRNHLFTSCYDLFLLLNDNDRNKWTISPFLTLEFVSPVQTNSTIVPFIITATLHWRFKIKKKNQPMPFQSICCTISIFSMSANWLSNAERQRNRNICCPVTCKLYTCLPFPFSIIKFTVVTY